LSPDLPLVSFVTPSLNQGLFIQQTIDSVLSQDYPWIEYVVVDGGSTDETLTLLERSDPRVRWTSEPDDGQADAINRALVAANGKYIAWLNSDDVYLPGAISAMVDFLETHPDHALVYGHADNIDANGRYIGAARQVEKFDARRLLNDIDFVAQPATLIRTELFRKAGGLDASLRWSFDYDLWLKLARDHPIGFLDKLLAQVRIHGGAKTTIGGLPRLLEIERMARNHGRRSIPSGFAARMAWLRMRASANAIRHARFVEAYREGRSGLASLAAYASYRLKRLPRLSHFDGNRGDAR
jgi:hypothetical protein